MDDDEEYKRYRRTDPDTSREAARSVTPFLSDLKNDVLAYYAQYRTSTDWLMDERMKVRVRGIDEHTLSTMRSRRNDLVGEEYIEDTKARMKHEHNNRERIVWGLTDKGKAWAAKWLALVKDKGKK